MISHRLMSKIATIVEDHRFMYEFTYDYIIYIIHCFSYIHIHIIASSYVSQCVTTFHGMCTIILGIAPTTC